MPGTFTWRPSYGFSGGPSYPHTVLANISGVETIIMHSDVPIHSWVVSMTNRSVEEMYEIQEFFNLNLGPGDTFLMPSYSDMTAADDVDSLPTLVCRFALEQMAPVHEYFDGKSWPDLVIKEVIE